jgi:hypothetical protein
LKTILRERATLQLRGRRKEKKEAERSEKGIKMAEGHHFERVEDCYLIKGDLNILQAEVVEGEHANIDQSERKDLTGNVGVGLKRRDKREEGESRKMKENERRQEQLLFQFNSNQIMVG